MGGMAAGCDMGEIVVVGKGGDNLVSSLGEIGCDALLSGKGGEDQQSALVQRFLPISWDALG